MVGLVFCEAWAKFGPRGLNKGKGFEVGMRYGTVEKCVMLFTEFKLEMKYSFMCKAYVADEWEGKRWTGEADFNWSFLEIGVCLPESLVTYICLLVIPLSEPGGP